MPILMMALVALLVFGLIGFLLSAAVILENSQHAREAKARSAHHGSTALHP